VAGGGGPSAIFSQPAWQVANGVPADSWRHVPDVSVTSSPHDGYLIYMDGGLYSVAGTSAATPAWAGVMALVNQQTGGRQGNANPVLYSLYRLQSFGGAPVLHDIVSGNNFSSRNSKIQRGSGYDQATGLGSPDVFQLVQHWNAANIPSMYEFLSSTSVRVTQGTTASVSVTTSLTKAFNAPVSLRVSGLPASIKATWFPSTIAAPGAGSVTLNLSAAASAPAGSYAFQVIASGGGITQSVPVVVTVVARKAGH